ncbi:PRC-barrel domain-containing protein [Tautonia marina]|uniref:PRC-barrel domain-containing protein n=1 Tax=Tautonia marina TaxID=2653855 RepID=UPI0013761AA3|nr:PRC-barrel domain-containing protein [Tautonia marina]
MSVNVRLFAATWVAGSFLTTVSFGQVVEVRPAPQPGQQVPADPAILEDDEQSTTTDAFAGLRRVSELLGGEARGPGDEGRIAAISDLIMDGQGQPHYVLLSRGGLAGVGGDKIAVPFQVGTFIHNEDQNWHYQLNMTGDQLDQAPVLEEGSLAPLRDPNWVRVNRQFFKAEVIGDEAGTGDDSFLFRADALVGAEVRGQDEEDSIANVDDVILGPDFRATYVILGYGGVAGLGKNQVPVPFSMLQLDAEADDDRYELVVTVQTTKERLQSETAPTLDGNEERMLDPTFLDRVHEYFGVNPS